ncbi:formylglycine-generating enzyme family protein [Bradyrhizobium canariense]|uniref:Formylglycine-generating enzyme, required for sulfatase activity, contains SUMF1/FGE domain n=1 Tax=Bradyrhizobium canariense TaxID=255045 RepID=A0A1H1ZF81_9BRAD|nr:formylglycine-generating enzyme family protein [Bradyrhizobium canariense]SDT32445.1 Formylglycine-generating enzyme, required for sulfatase activity, contains SUMF1/FGE domain [Bradyrhizobium canariense]
MSVKLKLLAALAAATLAISLIGTASAKTKPVRPKPPEQKQQPQPASPPQQIIPVKGVQPLTPEIEQSLKPKDSFKECDVCPEMVVIPKGSFIMGTPPDEPYRLKGEDPQHSVTIARPIAVGRFSITFDEWDACLADGGCNGNKGDDGGYGRGRMPAAGIDFAAAKAYLAWLSRKVGRTYRLPSESEREYFTRAGTTTPFWFGKTISSQNANYNAMNNYPGGPYGEASKGPKPVDAYLPNKFGLYQVTGNVEEWTEDCYNKRYNEDTPSDGSPWLEGDCTRRMLRGGGWMGFALTQRSGYRNDFPVGTFNSFRVVRTLAVQP